MQLNFVTKLAVGVLAKHDAQRQTVRLDDLDQHLCSFLWIAGLIAFNLVEEMDELTTSSL